MNRNRRLKLEIYIQKEILEKNGYDFDKSVAIICNGLKEAGLEKELVEEGNIIYVGTGSDKDLAYIGLVTTRLIEQQWFKDCCIVLDLLIEDRKTPGEFLLDGSIIESAKARGLW